MSLEQNVENNELIQVNETSITDANLEASEVTENISTTEPTPIEVAPTVVEESKVVEIVETANPTLSLSDEEKSSIEKELDEFNTNGTSFKVEFVDKTIGGFRVAYKSYSMFLPISHVSNKRIPSNEELEEIKNGSFDVNIQDVKSTEDSKTYVVSRKKYLASKVWDSIKVGDEVEGVVTSTPTFGAFIDLGGFEGLVHISKLSRRRINKTTEVCKKGDTLKAKVIEIDKANKKISLSHQEYEPSPWNGVEARIPKGSKKEAIVRRITNFGVYLELEPGVDGLLRNGEISWTKRFKEASDILKTGSKVEVLVKDLNEEKENATLSIKALTENPWLTLKDRYPIDSVYFAKVNQINPKGVVFELNDEVDGFMPKSKISGGKRNAPITYNVGDMVEVVIAEIVPENESLILRPNVEVVAPEPKAEMREKIDDKFKKTSKNSGFSFGDLLSEAVITDLNKIG